MTSIFRNGNSYKFVNKKMYSLKKNCNKYDFLFDYSFAYIFEEKSINCILFFSQMARCKVEINAFTRKTCSLPHLRKREIYWGIVNYISYCLYGGGEGEEEVTIFGKMKCAFTLSENIGRRESISYMDQRGSLLSIARHFIFDWIFFLLLWLPEFQVFMCSGWYRCYEIIKLMLSKPLKLGAATLGA